MNIVDQAEFNRVVQELQAVVLPSPLRDEIVRTQVNRRPVPYIDPAGHPQPHLDGEITSVYLHFGNRLFAIQESPFKPDVVCNVDYEAVSWALAQVAKQWE